MREADGFGLKREAGRDLPAVLQPSTAAGQIGLCNGQAVCYMPRHRCCFALFPGSSVVEQPAVNRLVAGSNPARGANNFKHLARNRTPKCCNILPFGPLRGPLSCDRAMMEHATTWLQSLFVWAVSTEVTGLLQWIGTLIALVGISRCLLAVTEGRTGVKDCCERS